MPLIGTAGHVDHGKSTLILALTGRDPDRFEEEKRRGLTIDLGFSWADLGGGTEVSFVDVPGHERFLKNMLAGVDAIDVALLIVAANEGWMPQTEEHLAILDLLDVPAGVVALTKTDLVDEDRLEGATAQILEKVAGTRLEGAAVIPVSSIGGTGLDELRSELSRLAATAGHPLTGRPRMWVDRSFSIRGAGTVVTGSLLGGPLTVGDQVRIYPGDRSGRIRSIQTHERAVDTAAPGARVALGLAGVDVADVMRGDMIGVPGEWRTTRAAMASLRTARYIDEIPERGAYQAHIGTSTVNTTIVKRDEDRALLRFDDPLPIAAGDRLILRDTGRKKVVSGGIVLDPAPRARSRERLVPGTPDEMADALLELRSIARLDELGADTNGGRPSSGVVVGDLAVSAARLRSLIEESERLVEAEHRANPLRPGLPVATLAASLGAPRPIVEKAVADSPRLSTVGPDVAEVGHDPGLDAASEEVWRRARGLLEAGLSVPAVPELGLDQELIHLLARRGELIRVSVDLAFLPEQIDQVTEAVDGLPVPFQVGDFKDALGLSRKYAMPLLEWLDANHFTVRRPDGRVPGPGPSSAQ